jgi:hypothetical protein
MEHHNHPFGDHLQEITMLQWGHIQVQGYLNLLRLHKHLRRNNRNSHSNPPRFELPTRIILPHQG